MVRKTAFVNEMILKHLTNIKQTVSPVVHKAATLGNELGEILNRKKRE